MTARTEGSTAGLMASALESADQQQIDVAALDAELTARTSDGPLAIAELADALGVSAHTIRYYEKLGLISPDRDGHGHRRYHADTISRLAFLIRMRVSGMGIRDLQHYVELLDGGEDTVTERLDLMLEHRDTLRLKIRELQLSLAVTEYKIQRYQGDCR